MVSTPRPPKAPDPQQTANQQTKANVAAATSQAGLNMVNQVDPYGTNLTYSGHTTSNNKVRPGDYTATVTYSPEQKALLDQQLAIDKATNQIAIDQTDKIGGLLGTNVDLSPGAAEARTMELQQSLIDPINQKNRAALESKLYNQGVQPGTEAWNNAMQVQGRNESDQLNSLLLQGHQQAVGDILTERNQPINEITGLLGTQQINTPSFLNTPQGQIAPADIAGYRYQNYQGALNNYNQQLSSQNAMYGAIGQGVGALGAFGGWKFSDARVKDDIKRIGETDAGLGIYKFRYKGTDQTQIGLMAQEVEQTNPDAVAEINGIKAVNYDEAV